MRTYFHIAAMFAFYAASASAQDAPIPASEKNVAWVRCWAALGDDATYSLKYAGKNPKEETVLFSGIKGDYRTGYGPGYSDMPPGKYRFTLSKDGAPGVSTDEITLEKGTAYTVIATLDHGRPSLRFVTENPAPPEESGIYIYKFVAASLAVRLGEKAPQEVTANPMFLPAVLTGGQPVTLTYQGRRNLNIRTQVEPTPGQRVSVVFMRNHYNQPTLFVLPSEPRKETRE